MSTANLPWLVTQGWRARAPGPSSDILFDTTPCESDASLASNLRNNVKATLLNGGVGDQEENQHIYNSTKTFERAEDDSTMMAGLIIRST